MSIVYVPLLSVLRRKSMTVMMVLPSCVDIACFNKFFLSSSDLYHSNTYGYHVKNNSVTLICILVAYKVFTFT